MSHADKPRRALIVYNDGTVSSVVRAVQFQPLFQQSTQWQADYVARNSVVLHKWLQRLNRPALPLVMALLHRPLGAFAARWHRKRQDEIVRRAKDYDLVYVVKDGSLELYRRLKALGRPKVVADFNDGLWLPYFRDNGWSGLDTILACVDGVIAENDHVAEYARRHNPRVFVVSDAPQIEIFDRQRHTIQRHPQRVVLGWIGSEENIGHLYRLMEPLEALFARHPHLHLRIVGARFNFIPHFEHVRWSCQPVLDQTHMVCEVLGFDIGLFPLFHLEDGRARGTLKAKVYMSGGCVAVCEDYGENPKLIRDFHNGVLASTAAEWQDKLERLILHPEERRAIARQGLEDIREEYTGQHVFERLLGAFDRITADE